MLNKQVTKIIQNLEKKKFREKYNLFKIEGNKLVGELLRSGLPVHTIVASPEWIGRNRQSLGRIRVIEADEREMKTISNFQSLPEAIALAEIPACHDAGEDFTQSLSLALNGIQDPGNLGTILRLADWFGVRNILCDRDCASAYNPKCVQASMGAIFRVRPFYVDLSWATKGKASRPKSSPWQTGASPFLASPPAKAPNPSTWRSPPASSSLSSNEEFFNLLIIFK